MTDTGHRTARLAGAGGRVTPKLRNKPGVLPDEKLESYKASVAREVGKTARSREPVSEVLARFYARFICPACGSPAACQHRNRKLDVALILRREA